MFEASLKNKFKSIFEVKKVTFDDPGDAQEQECLFIEIENARNVIKDDRAKSMVTGSCVLYGNNDKLPFAFFSKKIKEADAALTKDLFFYDIEQNTRTFRNIVARGFSFIYFFDTQYDPDQGTINAVEFIEE